MRSKFARVRAAAITSRYHQRVLITWWRLVAGLSLLIAGAALGFWWPQLVDAIQALFRRYLALPLPLRMGVLIGTALALAVGTALTVVAYRESAQKTAQEQASRDAEHAKILSAATAIDERTQTLQRIASETASQTTHIDAVVTETNSTVLTLLRGAMESTRSIAQRVMPVGLPRALHLVGREDDLRDVTRRLVEGESAGILVLEGMGGVGKTALAAEAVWQLVQDEDMFPGGAVWIQCDDLEGPAGLAELWVRLAHALGLQTPGLSSGMDIERLRTTIAQTLMAHARILIALDNIEPGLNSDVVFTTLAIPDHTTLLATARYAVLSGKILRQDVARLSTQAGTALFAHRLAQCAPQRPTDQDTATIPSLVDLVGGLALAVELLAAYVGNHHLSVQDVLDDMESHSTRTSAIHHDPYTMVTATFDRSWNRLSRSQQNLLSELAELEGSFRRTGVIEGLVSTQDGDETTDRRLRSDFDALTSAFLLEPLSDDYVRIHPLVRDYARAHAEPSMAQGAILRWHTVAVEMREEVSAQARALIAAGAAPIRAVAHSIADLEVAYRDRGIPRFIVERQVVNRTIGDVDLRRVSAIDDGPEFVSLADDLGIALPGEFIGGVRASGAEYLRLRQAMLEFERRLLVRGIDLRMYDLAGVGNPLLREMLSDYARRQWGFAPPPAQIYLSLGAQDGLDRFFRGFAMVRRRAGDEHIAVVFPAPAFNVPEWQAHSLGLRLHRLTTRPEDGFKVTPELLDAALAQAPDIRAFYLSVTSNPTTFAYSADELRALFAVLRDRDVVIVADLAYIGTGNPILDRQRMEAFNDPETLRRTVFVNTFSKTLTLTGDRCGWVGFGDPAFAASLAMAWTTTIASFPAEWQLYYMALIDHVSAHPDLEQRIRAFYAHRRAQFAQQLRSLD